MIRERYSDRGPQYLPTRAGQPDLGSSIIQIATEPPSRLSHTDNAVQAPVESPSRRRKTPEIPGIEILQEQGRGHSVVDVVAPAKEAESDSRTPLRTETFASLVELAQDARHVVEGIVPSALMIHGRRIEQISKDRVAVRFGAMGILRVNTGPDTVDDKKNVIKSKRELVLSGEEPGMKSTTHNLDGATIADYGDFTRINFAPIRNDKGNYTATTSVDITPDGLEKTTTFTPNDGLNPLRKINPDNLPTTISLPSEVDSENGKPTTYSLEHAKAQKTATGVEIVLPATDHLSSLSVTTLRISAAGVEKTVKVVTGGIAYQAQAEVPSADAQIDKEVMEAVELRKEVVAVGVRKVEAGEATGAAPTLPYEGQGEIAKAELNAIQDAEKAANKVTRPKSIPKSTTVAAA